MADFDLVVRGGLIADGTGADLFEGDVAIKDGKIVQVGDVLGTGTEEIDARGKLVTPGFVDIHTHFDGQATWDSRFSPSTNHGVTTLLMGNCGVGFAPCRPDQREKMIDVMEGVEDIPGIVLAEGLPWNWETFPDYMNALDQRKMDADFAVAVPHIPVRVYVMGERGINREPARSDDMQKMAAIVKEGMEAGALGFSTTRVIGHRTAGGDQLPVTTASEDELLTIAMAMKSLGKKSLFMTASEFDTGNGFSSEFRMLERIAETSGQTLTFPLLQYNEAPTRWREIADACAAARGRGVDMYGQVVGRPVGLLFGLELTQHPFIGCPSFDALANLSFEDKVKAMRDPAVRAAILAEVETIDSPDDVPVRRKFHLFYAMGEQPNYSPSEYDRFDNVAKRLGVSQAEVAYDTIMANDGRGIIYFPARNFTDYNLDTVLNMLQREETVLGLGDGGAHVGGICDGSMQTFLLSYWTRDRVGPKLSIPWVVQHMTSHTANIAGFRDRGVVKAGYKGDLNVIDYDRLGLHAPHVTYDLPAGGRRLYQTAEGYDATIVSGVVTYRDGKPTGELPGRLVRGQQPAPALAGEVVAERELA
jgi:N-acyl-D-aspartate/D-glutamate deacylase